MQSTEPILCSAEGCSKPKRKRVFCENHYRVFMRNGTTYSRTREELFWGDIDRSDPEQCWMWDRARGANGYGRFGAGSGLAHRLAIQFSTGSAIPAGMHVDHLCRTRACVNPAHLDVVTPLVNALRRDAATGRGAGRLACPSGHEYDEENTYLSPSNRRHCRACARYRYHRDKQRKTQND